MIFVCKSKLRLQPSLFVLIIVQGKVIYYRQQYHREWQIGTQKFTLWYSIFPSSLSLHGYGYSYPFCWGNYFSLLMVTKIIYSSMCKWVPIWLSFPSISQCRMSESCTLITVQLLQHLDHAMSYAQLLCYCTGLLYHIKYAKVWYLTEFSSFRIAF